MADEKAPKAKVEFEAAGTQTPKSAAQAPKAEEPAVKVEADAGAGAQGGQPGTADGVASITARIQAWVHQTFPGNEHAFWGGVCGFIVALVFFALGIWRTLVILVLVLAGVAIGQLRDGKTKVIDAIRQLFSSNR